MNTLPIEEQCHYLLVDIYEMQNSVKLHGILPNPETKQFKKCLKTALAYLKHRNQLTLMQFIELKYDKYLKK